MTQPDADGKCRVTEYIVDLAAGLYPGDPDFACPPDPVARWHKKIPVENEACLYSLWMCACWANQADGCLCAFENPLQASVTIMKPSAGGCPPGAGKMTDTTAAGDSKGHILFGMGGLALKCTPNPCQACC